MSTIFNLRGTSGAGKSTVAHTILKLFNHRVVEWGGASGKKPMVYEVTLRQGKSPLYILGGYRTQCGGCDGITDYQTIVPLLLSKYAPKGHILFEGLLISGGYGSVGRSMTLAERKGHTAIFALLDTPLELCLKRIGERRLLRGKTEPLNPKNTEQKFKAARNTQEKLIREGHSCVMIDHKRPVKEVLKYFDVILKMEPNYARAEDHQSVVQ
jgi:ABC-type dipeptide/oligopeptide/nickel transport system ATPase component